VNFAAILLASGPSRFERGSPFSIFSGCRRLLRAFHQKTLPQNRDRYNGTHRIGHMTAPPFEKKLEQQCLQA